MFECDYCGNNVLDSQESVDGLHHDICQDEWNKRYNSGMCVKCGNKFTGYDYKTGDSDMFHKTCTKYADYPASQ